MKAAAALTKHREREATGISSLKVRYNRVFGYYIEITQAHVKNAPAHYQRKQTTVGAERFFTEELKKFEGQSRFSRAEYYDATYHYLSGLGISSI